MQPLQQYYIFRLFSRLIKNTQITKEGVNVMKEQTRREEGGDAGGGGGGFAVPSTPACVHAGPGRRGAGVSPTPRLREAHLSQTSTRLQPDVGGQQRPCDAGRSVRDFGAADLDNSAA